MEEREVTKVRKDNKEDIIALCGPGTWSPRSKQDVIHDIENKLCNYFVRTPPSISQLLSSLFKNYGKIEIHVVLDKKYGKYLRTDPDKTTLNNLDNLPSC